MESLLEPVELNRETARALDEIRSGAENALYGAASADAEQKVNNSVLPLIEGAGLPGLHVMHYRWYLRELARHWRTRRGRDLAFHLELCIRKWVGLGLEPRTLQFLICEAHQRLKGKYEVQSGNDECRTGTADAGLNTKHALSEVEGTQSHQAGTTMNDERGTMNERTKDAKTAKSEDSIPRSLDPSIPCSSHSISLSLDPSIPSASTTKTPSHQAGATMNDERGTMNERTKDAKTARPEHSIPLSLDPSIPEVSS